MTRHDLPRAMRYPQPISPPGDPMPVPPDGRHPLYPTAPKHLNPVTAEAKAVNPPRHAPPEHLPTTRIPKIDDQRIHYPPWTEKLEEAGERFGRRLGQSKAALLVLCLLLLAAIVLLGIYAGTHI